METGKDDPKVVDKRAYHRPQLTQFGSVANITQVNQPGIYTDNEFGDTMGDKFPPGISS
jgi:hypothetical protein